MEKYELRLGDYWHIIQKRKYSIILTTMVVALGTMWLTTVFAPEPQFKATTRVKYDKSTNFEGLLAQAVSYSYSDEIGSQAEVIKSFPVIEGVARELQILPIQVSTPEVQQSESYLNAIYDLQSQIETLREGATNIITITASAPQGPQAAKIANAVAHAYYEHNIEARNRLVNDSRQFAEMQIANTENNLKQAEEALQKYQEQGGKVLLTEEARIRLNSLTGLESNYQVIRFKRLEAENQIRKLDDGHLLYDSRDEATMSGRIYTGDPNQILYLWNVKLGQLLQERDALFLDVTAEHPKAKAVEWEIQGVQSEMMEELESKISFFAGQEARLKVQIEQHRDEYRQFPQAAIEFSRLEREVTVISGLYTELRTTHQEMLIKSSQQIEEVTILEPAVIPQRSTTGAKRWLKFLLGSLLGLTLGIVLAFIQESVDPFVGSIKEIKKELGVPIWGYLPLVPVRRLKTRFTYPFTSSGSQDSVANPFGLVFLMDPESRLIEHYRAIRSNFQFACVEQEAKSILMTNLASGIESNPRASDSTTLVNFAFLLAEHGKRVLLVDANFRSPKVHRLLGLPCEPGLSDVLVRDLDWRDHVRNTTDLMLGSLGIEQVMSHPEFDYFHVLTAGTTAPNPLKLIHSENFGELVKGMKNEYDYVLFGAPPFLSASDSIGLSSMVDGVVLLAQDNHTRRDALQQFKELLQQSRARLLGVVLTQTQPDTFFHQSEGMGAEQLVHQT